MSLPLRPWSVRFALCCFCAFTAIAHGQGQVPEEIGIGIPEDLPCATGPDAAVWARVKAMFKQVTASPQTPASREALSGALEKVMEELNKNNLMAASPTNQCGMGRLCLQLLSVATIDDPAVTLQIFTAVEQLASPTLTFLLDIPWSMSADAGWPIFGLLNQLNFKKSKMVDVALMDQVDGLTSAESRQTLSNLKIAMATHDMAGIQDASRNLLALTAGPAPGALGGLTAMAAQAAAPAQGQPRLHVLGDVQVAMRQAIGTASELDLALGTQWPLWGLLQQATDLLASGA